MNLHPRPALVIAVSVSLLIHGVGCSSSGSIAADVEQPAATPEHLPTRESLGQLDTGTRVVVVRKDSTALMGWFEGIEEPRSGSTGAEDSSLFRVVLRYRPDYGTFQGFSRTPSDSIDRILTVKDATTEEIIGGLVTSFVLVGVMVGTIYFVGILGWSQGW